MAKARRTGAIKLRADEDIDCCSIGPLRLSVRLPGTCSELNCPHAGPSDIVSDWPRKHHADLSATDALAKRGSDVVRVHYHIP